MKIPLSHKMEYFHLKQFKMRTNKSCNEKNKGEKGKATIHKFATSDDFGSFSGSIIV